MGETSSSSSHLLSSQAQLLENVEMILRFVAVEISMPARVKFIVICDDQRIAIPTGDLFSSDLSLDISISIYVFK